MRRKVHLSHKRVLDERSSQDQSLNAQTLLSSEAEKVIEWGALNEFDVLADKYDAEKFRPIDEFITDLEQTSGTIFLLNSDFFKSRWCMSELCNHYLKFGAYFHSVYLPSPGWVKGDPQDFIEGEKNKVLEYWGNQSIPPEFRESFQQIEKIFEELKLINFEIDLLEDQASGLWLQLNEMEARDRLLGSSPNFKEFDKGNKRAIRDQLQRCEFLIEASDSDDSETLVEKLFNIDDPRDRIVEFFKIASVAVNNRTSNDSKRIRQAAQQIAICLSHYLLNSALCFSRTKARENTVMNEPIDLKETSTVVTELVVVSAHEASPGSMCLGFEQNKDALSGSILTDDQAVHPSRIVRNSSYVAEINSSYEELLSNIAKLLLPDENFKQGQYLSEHQRCLLRDQLRDDFDTGYARYIAVPANQPNHTLNKIANVRRLKKELPHLIVVRTSVEDVEELPSEGNHERRIAVLLKKFADL